MIQEGIYENVDQLFLVNNLSALLMQNAITDKDNIICEYNFCWLKTQ